MQNNKIILFDIDYTLFNGIFYRLSLWEKLGEKYQPSSIANFADLAEETYLSLREVLTYFETELFAQALEKKTGIPIDPRYVHEVTNELASSQTFIYEEVVPVLEELGSKKNVTIGIFSTGLTDLQSAKIASIKHLLNEKHIHILQNKKVVLPEVLQMYQFDRLFLVDDYWEVLQDAKRFNSAIVTVWIKRGRHAEKLEQPEGFNPNAIIGTLEELLPIVDKEE